MLKFSSANCNQSSHFLFRSPPLINVTPFEIYICRDGENSLSLVFLCLPVLLCNFLALCPTAATYMKCGEHYKNPHQLFS